LRSGGFWVFRARCGYTTNTKTTQNHSLGKSTEQKGEG
jgi:hypothetical protein